MITYGDPTAFMGNGFFSSRDQLQFNAPHRDQVGWFPSNRIHQITQSGFYTLSPLNSVPQNVAHNLTFRLRHPDTNEQYYFSYMTIRSNYSHKALIHSWANATAPTMILKALTDGKYFTDRFLRFSVTQWSSSTAEMKLWVVFGCLLGPTFVDFFAYRPVLNAPFSSHNHRPSVLWYNTTTVNLQAGDTVTFTIRLANSDSPLCTHVTYALTPTIPPGWTSNLPPFILLTPGQTCFLEFSVTAPASAAASIYPVSVQITGKFGCFFLYPL